MGSQQKMKREMNELNLLFLFEVPSWSGHQSIFLFTTLHTATSHGEVLSVLSDQSRDERGYDCLRMFHKRAILSNYFAVGHFKGFLCHRSKYGACNVYSQWQVWDSSVFQGAARCRS